MSQREGQPERLNWSLRPGVSTAITVVVVVGLVAVIIGVMLSARPDNEPTYQAGLVAVVPEPDAQSPRNSVVGVRLSPGYVPTSLTIEGTAVSLDELDAGITQQGQYYFLPGEGKSIERLAPGLTCASVRARSVVDAQLPTVSYRWCFTLV